MIDNLRVAGNTSLVLPRHWQGNALSSPSWIEEFRVYRALWRLQLYSDLRYAATPIEDSKAKIPTEEQEQERGRWSWSVTDIELINAYTPLGAIFQQKIEHEIQAVTDVLIDLGAAVSSQFPPADHKYSLPFFTSLQVSNPADHPVCTSSPGRINGHDVEMHYG
ncbi:hypothetical protein PHISCL_02594 [Aspergillus sclerotialis]|uniref:Uncharacterized protein n=1 Tax=Aspergillus sclerotialis TaxID=2070753 RepID=A0A3A2ZPE4_9EURO|nr:hypothetical protein PHISCL_02594 [Aspergillus sclerotialis]